MDECCRRLPKSTTRAAYNKQANRVHTSITFSAPRNQPAGRIRGSDMMKVLSNNNGKLFEPLGVLRLCALHRTCIDTSWTPVSTGMEAGKEENAGTGPFPSQQSRCHGLL